MSQDHLSKCIQSLFVSFPFYNKTFLRICAVIIIIIIIIIIVIAIVIIIIIIIVVVVIFVVLLSLWRQRGRVVRAPDLKSVGRGFKSRSDR